MKLKRYFAYGSNMNHEQMMLRCPSAIFLKRARLENHKFVYDGYSKKRNGAVANIIKSSGDIAWGGPRNDRNLNKAKAILDNLNNAGIPYIPLIGDNEVQTGCEKEFDEVFGRQGRYLSNKLMNWQKKPQAFLFLIKKGVR